MTTTPVMRSSASPGLRTKTGCLTCRKRRKKCDEVTPICGGCRSTGRSCQWPASTDMRDRRFAAHERSRYRSSHLRTGHLGVRNDTSGPSRWANNLIAHDVEVVVSQHFSNQFYGLIMLPTCFYHGWLAEIQELMPSCEALYYSVLACAASHLHLRDSCATMQQLALTYYSNALKKLSSLLAHTSNLEKNNGLLSSVILLNIHGCMGRGTYLDIPRHLDAATGIVTSRFRAPDRGVTKLFDILALESVLYHTFHVSVGLWSDDSSLPVYRFDLEFWHKAEQLLEKSTFFPTSSSSFRGPVLGVPPSLLRLALSLSLHCRGSIRLSDAVMRGSEKEVNLWEVSQGLDQGAHCASTSKAVSKGDNGEGYCQDATALYAIIVSLLWKRMQKFATYRSFTELAKSHSGHMNKALVILRKHTQDDGWAACFIGNWPIYTLGLFVSSEEQKAVIRADLRRRWELTRLAQTARYLSDLEAIWECCNSLSIF